MLTLQNPLSHYQFEFYKVKLEGNPFPVIEEVKLLNEFQNIRSLDKCIKLKSQKEKRIVRNINDF